jgi:endonuclease/exonuclease/phosphatase family metal-dependent hydrolase
MTWNVHGSERPDIDGLAAAIRAESPDVVVVQEIRSAQARQLAERLPMRYTWALKHRPYTVLVPWCSEGMAIFTPHALDAPGHTEVSDDQPMRSWRRRIAQWALIGRVADRSFLTVYNLHLSPHQDRDARRAEADRVAEIVARNGDDPPPVVAGDFNDADDPSIIVTLPGVEHLRPADSSPAVAPTQLLDHVLVPADAVDVAATVPAGGAEWAALSDHLPVTVRFTITPGV